MRGRKLELEHFLSQHGVDICFLSETFLNPRQAFRLANYVCHRKERPTAGGGTAILVRRGIVHHSVSVAGLTHLQATATQIILAGRPMKILAAYFSPSRPLIGEDLTACLGGGLPALMTGDLNAKHVDRNSGLNTRRGKLLRDYVDENSCQIFGCLGYRDGEGPPVPGVSHFVLCTKLGPPPGTHRNCVSHILSTPTGTP